MSSLSIGLSGVLVSQRMIELHGQNVTNADTPGYHRQVGELAMLSNGGEIGAGVEIKHITRVIDRLLEDAIVRNTSSASGSAESLTRLNQLQAFLAPGEGSLHDALSRFFNAAEALSTQPDDMTLRRVFLAAAGDLTDRLNVTAEQLSVMRNDLVDQAKTLTAELNTLTSQIGTLNQQIHASLAVGGTASELQDQRDAAVAKLAELIDVRVVQQEYGVVNIFAGGNPLVVSASVAKLTADLDTQNRLAVTNVGTQQPFEVTGGRLGSTLALTNAILPDVNARFDAFADALVTGLDHIQATGLSLNGPLTSLTSERPVVTPNLPLGVSNLPYPVKAGELYITVTDLATGTRTLNRLNIDPATQSLSDVAAAISTVPNIQGVVDVQAGTLSIVASPGYGFDFTGNFSSSPDTLAITGTATPTLSGRYTGAANDSLNFRFVGTGTIGATANLTMEVRNGAGVLLTSRNVGAGYEPGTALQDILGVRVALSAGSVNNGDTFSLNGAANPDSAGLLPALGMNTFLVGDGASGVHVNPALLEHPENLALATSSQPGDGTNLARLIALRDERLLDGNKQSFQRFLEDIIGNVGAQAQDMEIRKAAFDALGQQLDKQRQGISGVDPNEELMKLVQFQRMYQVSAHFISVVNQTMDDLLRIVG